jgi:D-alanine--poly(phosphoribitol) ligase subunit 1
MLSGLQEENIAARFMRHALMTPDALAVVDDAGTWQYQRLAEEAAALARLLGQAGAAEGTLVGLSVRRGWRVVAGILAIWLKGCAYVPIDPEYPAMRRTLIAADARVHYIITEDTDGGVSVVCTEALQPAHTLPIDAAYVIYTSGSTGTPKGVIVTHGNIRSLLDSSSELLPVRPCDVGTVFHSSCFDLSVWEIWRMLTAGGRCVYVPREATFDANRFAHLLSCERIFVLNLVPSVFANLVRVLRGRPVPLPALREVIFGGEPLNVNAIREWYELGLAPNAELVNMYGITETTVHVTARRLDRQEIIGYRGTGTPIGRPLPHLQVAVLGDRGQPVPAGGVVSSMSVLRDALRERLPRYMLPARLLPITELPVTPEGKLDRAALTGAVARKDGNAAS